MADNYYFRHQLIEQFENLLRTIGKDVLTKKNVWIGGGTALCLHGLRSRAGDIDAGCSEETFWAFMGRNKGLRSEIHHKSEGYLNDNTQLVRLPEFNVDLHLEPNIGVGDLVRGDSDILIYSLPKLLEQKLALNREKDQLDIRNLREALRKKR